MPCAAEKALETKVTSKLLLHNGCFMHRLCCESVTVAVEVLFDLIFLNPLPASFATTVFLGPAFRAP